ncbi:MAG: small basic protein [Planctomycetes bacterium]|nr:small basic protein [Planctomycetota bacterium]
MSIHSSLRGVDTLKGERSVFTRTERIAILKKAGKFNDETASVYGLQKVRTRYKVAGAKKAPKAEAAAAAGAAAKPGAAAPAAAAAAKKPAAKK